MYFHVNSSVTDEEYDLIRLRLHFLEFIHQLGVGFNSEGAEYIEVRRDPIHEV